MNKKYRILLYVLSIVMVAGCIAAVARTKGSTPEVKVPDEGHGACGGGWRSGSCACQGGE